MTPPSPPIPRRPPSRRRGRLRWWIALAALPLLMLAAALAMLGVGPLDAWHTLRSRPTMEMVRYAEFRLIGHPVFEALLLPVLGVVRHQLEREPGHSLPDLGKGQQSDSLPPPVFDAVGTPQDALPAPVTLAQAAPGRLRNSIEDIREGVGSAEAGEVLEIAPGTYTIDRTLITGHAGEPGRPITLRARRPGTVLLLVSTTQGFVVNRAHWVFENLNIRGNCPPPDECEHAFHVVGAAVGTLIRNNLITDFNAHIKVNGEDGRWPDGGLIQFNTLANTRPRNTDRPVTTIDLVGADRWRFVDNLVKGFVKNGGNGISFGMFMKGAGSQGRIERNLVICTPQGISQPGLRVGISIGGGGTGPAFCRDGQCAAEFADAVVANNVVAHCNDQGIDVNRGQRTLVAYNTLVNTLGIVVRDKPADATVQGNLLEGSIRPRNGGQLRQDHNLIVSRLDDALVDADGLDLRWRELPAMLPAHPMVHDDFCAHPRPNANPPGATLSGACIVAPAPADGGKP